MPLSFDPRALMAPGGVINGLDNLGSAVVTALNRRAERKYALEAEARHRREFTDDRGESYRREGEVHTRDRGERNTDRTEERGYQAGLHTRDRGEKVIDRTEERGYQEGLHTRGRTELATDRERQDIEQAADRYSPTMADPYGDLQGALAAGKITRQQFDGYRVRRDAAKAKYEQDEADRAYRHRPAHVNVPSAKTYVDPTNPTAEPLINQEARVADLAATAGTARAVGNQDQAKELEAQARGLSAVTALGPAPADNTATRMSNIPFGDFWASPEYQDLHIPSPKGAETNSVDVYNYLPSGEIGFRERPNKASWGMSDYYTDEADENYFEEDTNRIGHVQQALAAFRTRRQGDLSAEHAKKLAAYKAQRSQAILGTLAPENAGGALSPEDQVAVDALRKEHPDTPLAAIYAALGIPAPGAAPVTQ